MNRYFLYFIAGALLSFLIAVDINDNQSRDFKSQLEQKQVEQDIQNQTIQDLKCKVDSLNSIVSRTRVVSATVYYPTGHEMRSSKLIPKGYKQGVNNPKYIAISQDLWIRNGGPFAFGDSVQVWGTPYDGIYVIEDTMNKRFKNMIDVLVENKKPPNKWMNVTIYKV